MITAAFVAIVVSMLGRLLADEFKSYRSKIVDYLVIRAANKLPENMRERYIEEWRGYLADIPGDLSQVVSALGFSLVAGRVANTHNSWEQFCKRTFDIVFASIGLILMLPMFSIIGFYVWLYDYKAPMYGHKRLGRHGVPFTCLKFRSMRVDAENVLANHLAANPAALEEWMSHRRLKDDPRITPIGRVLRKTGLDELPQLINILRGDMSFTGPRPLVTAEIEKYGDSFHECFSVRPGLTGLWQVNSEDDQNYETRVAQDLDYVKRWSLKNDILILLKTISTVFSRRKKDKK